MNHIVGALAAFGAFTIVVFVVIIVALWQDGQDFHKPKEHPLNKSFDVMDENTRERMNREFIEALRAVHADAELIEAAEANYEKRFSKTERHLRLLKDE